MNINSIDYAPEKTYSGVVNYSFQVQLTFPESLIEKDHECGDDGCVPTDDAILESENDLKSHIKSCGHSVLSIKIHTDCDNLLGCSKFGDEEYSYTFNFFAEMKVNTHFTGSDVELVIRRKKSYLRMKDSTLDAFIDKMQNDLFQNYPIDDLEVTDEIDVSEVR